eukprot:TRINITY_DN22489_c0_g1_i1.p1 TRINITY_DN22489_c0_g1~~TRINITY_DN22489_c0_g1_i1.p1  ORF type:complete len:253 (+),score=53.43 TRINITY_DN22489_c0_g1_i1:55-759(+)
MATQKRHRFSPDAGGDGGVVPEPEGKAVRATFADDGAGVVLDRVHGVVMHKARAVPLPGGGHRVHLYEGAYLHARGKVVFPVDEGPCLSPAEVEARVVAAVPHGATVLPVYYMLREAGEAVAVRDGEPPCRAVLDTPTAAYHVFASTDPVPMALFTSGLMATPHHPVPAAAAPDTAAAAKTCIRHCLSGKAEVAAVVAPGGEVACFGLHAPVAPTEILHSQPGTPEARPHAEPL